MELVLLALGLSLVQVAFFYLARRVGYDAGHRFGEVAGSTAERQKYLANRQHLEMVHAEQLRRLQDELNAARAALAWGPYRRLERRAN